MMEDGLAIVTKNSSSHLYITNTRDRERNRGKRETNRGKRERNEGSRGRPDRRQGAYKADGTEAGEQVRTDPGLA